MEITNLFSTPLYTNKLIPKDTFTDILFTQYPQGYVSNSLTILNHFPNTKQQVEQHINTFIQQLGYKTKCKVTNSWVNKHYKQGYAQPHYHANAILSGVLFISTPPDSGIFRLFKPAPISHTILNAVFQLDKQDENIETQYTADHYQIQPTNNTIIIFPSTLIHEVSPSNTNQERMTLAFDVLPAEPIQHNTMSYYSP